jgi:hypothetical protein
MAGMAFTLPGVDEAVFKRAITCVPEPCAALSEAVAIRVELQRISDAADDAAFWGEAERRGCDTGLFKLLRSSPSAGLERVAKELGGDALPLEKLFGTQIAEGSPQQ